MNSGRISRKAGSYDRYSHSDNHYPHSRRSLYHYHRDHYPSSRIFYWVSWPNCCRPICYARGPHYTFGSFWPYYHRRFVFVSLGGYWPGYRHRRYYWYGCHPYTWYGDYPPAHVIAGDTYNYYYYNDAPQGEALNEAHKQFEEAPPAEPAEVSPTDRYFEQAVKAFEAGDYAAAAAKFRDAADREPGDIVLPFAYVQALFAGGEYKAAAAALREALAKASPEEEGVFFPRGLYPQDGILQQHIEQLARATQLDPSDSDLRLLLGYQLLGMDRLDEATEHLQNARTENKNSHSATVLIDLLEKLKKADSKNVDPDTPQVTGPKARNTEPGKDGNVKTPPKHNDEDVDIRVLAMAADNWLARE